MQLQSLKSHLQSIEETLVFIVSSNGNTKMVREAVAGNGTYNHTLVKQTLINRLGITHFYAEKVSERWNQCAPKSKNALRELSITVLVELSTFLQILMVI